MYGVLVAGFLRGFAAAEQGEGAFTGAVHHLLVVGNGLELLGDVGQIGGAAFFDGVLQRLEFGIEAEAVVLDLDVEAAAKFDGKSDGAELIGEILERGIAGPDEGAGSMAVGPGVCKGAVAGEGKVGLAAAAVGGEVAVGAGVAEEAGAEGFIDADVAIDGSGKDVVILLGEAGLGGEVSGAVFVDGDGVFGGLELGVLEGIDDASRGLGRERRGSQKRDNEREQSRMTSHG